MTSIDITDGGFTINGTASQVVVKGLQAAGLRKDVIAEVVGGWFVGVTGATTPAPFRFDTNVEHADPACTVNYARGFAHTDWIDGESRVQAGMTPEELGINARFHGIENEFDSVADQFRRLGSCVMHIRGDLSAVVDELQKKITTMQNQIHALQQQTKQPTTGPTILGTATIDGKDKFVTKFGDAFQFVEFEAEPIKTFPRPGVGPVFDPRALPHKTMIPLVLEIEQAIERPELESLFAAGGATVLELRRAGADVVLPSGFTLGAVLAELPADTRFETPAAAVEAIVGSVVGALPEAEAAGLRKEILAADAVDRTGSALLNSGVAAVATSSAVAGALRGAGFGTIAKLTSATSSEIGKAVGGAGSGISISQVQQTVARGFLGSAIRDRGIG